ncbi:MAG: class I SAM-dependent methyltransferase [Candidatus Diapherotrites archaeon]
MNKEERTYSWKTHAKILSELDFATAKRVADIGCGQGKFFDALKDINPAAKMFGIEADRQEAAKARAKGYTVVEPKKLASLGKGFDFVVMTEVIEHLSLGELCNYLSWAKSALKAGGWLAISTPNTNNIYMLYSFWDSEDHVRPYSDQAMRNLAEKFGFDYVKTAGVNNWANPRKVFVNLLLGMENSCNKIYFLRKK